MEENELSSGSHEEIFQKSITDLGNVFGDVVPRVSASISLISSLLIICIIFRSLTRLNSIYHRIMFGISVADIIVSTAIVFARSAMPRQGISKALDFYFASCDHRRGTIQTCNIQGFFFAVGSLLTSTYNSSLCWYYYCVIVKAMSDEAIRKRMEPFMHGIPIIWSLGPGITFLFLDAYNPGVAWCTVGECGVAFLSPFSCL
jgi:hypothetical protein